MTLPLERPLEDESVSKRTATAAGKKGPKHALKNLPDPYFSKLQSVYHALPTPSNMLRFTVTGVIFWEVSSERMEPVQPCQCPPHGQRGQTVWACPVTKSCPTLVTQWDFPAGLLCPWDCPGKNTGEGCHFLLQGIFPTQGSYPCLLH